MKISSKKFIKLILLSIFGIVSESSFAQFTIYNTSNSNLPSDFVHVSKMDSNNNLWIGTEAGLTKVDSSGWYTYNTTNSNLPSNWIETIEIFDTNEIWIGTRGFSPGLCLFNGDSIIHFDEINGVATPEDIYALKKDSVGNLWIGGGTYTYKYDGVDLMHLGSSGPYYVNSFELKNGYLWAGSNGKGLYKYDGSTWINYNESNSGIPSDYAGKIAIDTNNNVWMGGCCNSPKIKGLSKFDGSNWTNYNPTNSDLPSEVIKDIVIDDLNNIWIANINGGGLVKFDGTTFTIFDPANSNLPTTSILDLEIDNFDRLILSNYAGGICFYDIPYPATCNLSANYSHIDLGNGNYSFTNNSTGNFTQSHWAFGDGTTSTTTNQNHTFTTNGTFVVVLTINDSTFVNPCSTYYLDTVVVTGVVNPPLCAAGFVVYPDPDTLTGDITIVNSSVGNNLTYFWDFGDGSTSSLQNPSHTYLSSGPFSLCLMIDDGNGCVSTYCDSIGENGVFFRGSSFTVNVNSIPVLTGLDNEFNLEVSIYPNPTSGQLTILSSHLTITEVKILDINGKVMKTLLTPSTKVNVTDLPSGIYFVNIKTPEGTAIKKFVKQGNL